MEVKFDSDAYNEYIKLQQFVANWAVSREVPTYEQLLRSIDNAVRNLKLNPYFGDLIPRKLISRGIVQKYGTHKLFRIELVGYWRLLYTIIGDDVKITALVLEFMNHKKYDKIFGYSGI